MTFNVVSKGILPGTDPEQAKQSFAGLFGLDAEKVDRIFASSNLVIKPNVSDELAHKFVEKLTSIGVQAEAVAVEPKLELSLEPIATKTDENSTDSGYASSASESSSAYITPAQAAAIPQTQVKPFVFTGVGGEYFKIWIVNILLTIVTLGIYSAWAKVRNKRYFYGNTSMDGVAFEYTASPIKILIGRAIAVGFYIACVS